MIYSITIGGTIVDTQLKRGSLDICVLAALLKEDSYGYKIIKDLNNTIEISQSTLYPILKRLEKNGYISTYTIEHQGRLRKMFKISNSGIEKIKDYLLDFKELIKVYDFIEKEMNK